MIAKRPADDRKRTSRPENAPHPSRVDASPNAASTEDADGAGARPLDSGPDDGRHENLEGRATDDELRIRERQLRLVTDAMPMLIAYCDREMIYRFCNARYEDWFGLSQDDVVGKSVREVIGEDAFEAVRPYLDRALAGERTGFDGRLPYQYGKRRHVHVEYIPHSLPSGEVEGFYVMVEDVSERVEHERVRARLASIVEHSNDAIIGKALDGTITAWNRAAERMYGFTAEEMLGKPLEALIPESRAGESLDIIARLARGEQIEHFETVRQAKDGRELLVDLTASPIRNSRGKLVGVSAIVRDITERRERERSLRKSEERLRAAKNAAGLGIHDYDVRNEIIDWDERVRRIWGVGPDEKITFELFLSCVHPEDRSGVRTAVDRALDPSGDGTYQAEYRVIQRGTNTTRWVKATGLVTFENGQAVRLVGTVQDISEWRRMLEALEDADRRKDQFLATLGHELRNPLSAIVNTVEALRGTTTDERSTRLYDIVARQTEHMKSLLNDLLDIGRIRRGDIQLRRERLRLAVQVELATAALRSEIESKGHELRIDIDPPDVEVVADPVRLEQIIVNLLSNAAKYTPEPGVIAIRGGPTTDGVEITVTDTGIGFADAEQSRLAFELFYQARKGSGGLGIGLSVVKSLVDLHGGTVEARSDGPGRGSTLRVVLPMTSAPRPMASAAPKPPGSGLEHLKVLVVDDHEDSLTALKLLLERRCQLRTATNGVDALEEAQRFLPDVMVLDLALPDMSGFEIAAAVQEIPELRATTLIAMTGFGDSETSRQVAEAGFEAHLIKPVAVRELLELLDRAANPSD